jgi:hypothetical protein
VQGPFDVDLIVQDKFDINLDVDLIVQYKFEVDLILKTILM